MTQGGRSGSVTLSLMGPSDLEGNRTTQRLRETRPKGPSNRIGETFQTLTSSDWGPTRQTSGPESGRRLGEGSRNSSIGPAGVGPKDPTARDPSSHPASSRSSPWLGRQVGRVRTSSINQRKHRFSGTMGPRMGLVCFCSRPIVRLEF